MAYVTLEELMTDRSAVMQRLAAEYGAVFRTPLNLDRAPYKQLLDEFEQPFPFDESARATLDRAFDWEAEASIGYDRTGGGPLAHRGLGVAILHGGSATGKSHLITQLAGADGDRIPLEMDECAYWTDWTPEFRLETLRTLFQAATERDLEDLRALVDRVGPKGRRCIDFLLRRLAEIMEASPTPEAGLVVIATCGALPDPDPPGRMSIYTWLSDRVPIRFRHLLIEIPKDLHLERIEWRGRAHLTDEILELQAKKMGRRENFDAVIAGLDEAAREIAEFAGRPDLPDMEALLSFAAPRIYRTRLEYIQIFGERNSGTKFLAGMVAENARDPFGVLGSYANKKDPVNRARLIGYKHYYPRPERIAEFKDRTLFLVIYKNPYTWIRSMLAKPYHFRACLEGKTIADLPDIRLSGVDIHGRAIPDVHPETGEKLTLFELRRHKILKWEELKTMAQNVAFVTYEDLLVSPTEVLQQIVDAFPDLFRTPRVPQRQTDARYLEKYLFPETFSEADMEVMNRHLDWTVEAAIGYRMNNLFVKRPTGEI